jgi:pullulanase/glycogen debranching enzyme
MMRSGNGEAAYFSEAYPALKTYSTRSDTRFPPVASATAEGVNFRNANRVELLLYDAADSAEPVQIISLDPDKNRSYFFWHVLVEGLPAGTHYTWRVDGGKELLDPWARAVTDSVWIRRKAISGAESGRNSIRGVVTTASALSPAKSPIVPGLNGAVIYELHVDGFTRHPSSCVRYPGKFLGSSELKLSRRQRIRTLVRLSRLTEAHTLDELRDRNTPAHMEMIGLISGLAMRKTPSKR